MRTAPVVTLSIADRSVLERLAEAGEGLSALHAQVVNLAAQGKSNKEVAAILGVPVRTAARWRTQFLATGIAGIENRKASPGRPPTVSPEQVKQILAKSGEKRWSTRMMARVAGVSAATVRRILKSRGKGPLRPP
jgi:transposase